MTECFTSLTDYMLRNYNVDTSSKRRYMFQVSSFSTHYSKSEGLGEFQTKS